MACRPLPTCNSQPDRPTILLTLDLLGLSMDAAPTPQEFQDCSILMCDIVEFTKFSSQREAHHVVGVLNAMFTKFDDACDRLDVEKVKTIGDAFLAVGGVPQPDPQHMHKIALLGLNFLSLVEQLNGGMSSE